MDLSEIMDLAKARGDFYEKVLSKLDAAGLERLGVDPKIAEGKPGFEAADGVLRIDGPIWSWTMYKVREYLASATGPVEIRLASPGGDAAAGLAVYHMLRNYPGKVTTYADGIVSSAAAMIFLAGDERLMPEEGSATWMMHYVSTLWLSVKYGNKKKLSAEEPQKELDALVQAMEALDEAVVETLEKRSETGRVEIDKALESERYFTGAEAVEAGFATGRYAPKISPRSDMEVPEEFSKYAAIGAMRQCGVLDF